MLDVNSVSIDCRNLRVFFFFIPSKELTRIMSNNLFDARKRFFLCDLSLYLSLSLPSRPLCTVTRRHRANSIFVGDSHSIEYIDYYLSIVTIPITQFDGTKNVRTQSDTCVLCRHQNADASGYTQSKLKSNWHEWLLHPRIASKMHETERIAKSWFHLIWKGFSFVSLRSIGFAIVRSHTNCNSNRQIHTHRQTHTESSTRLRCHNRNSFKFRDYSTHRGSGREKKRGEEKTENSNQIKLSSTQRNYFIRESDVDRRNAAYSRSE